MTWQSVESNNRLKAHLVFIFECWCHERFVNVVVNVVVEWLMLGIVLFLVCFVEPF